jgi:dTDP-4-dehydrorhamnose 3,5-epimerase
MSGAAVHALDRELGIEWPIAIDPDDPALLSAKDRALPTLATLLR